MARKKINTAALNDIDEGVIKSITQRVGDLYRAHAHEIQQVREESDESKVAVRFGITIDCSDSTPKVTTTIRFASTVTDQLIDSLEDPMQPTLFTPEPRKGRSGKDAAAEPAERKDN